MSQPEGPSPTGKDRGSFDRDTSNLALLASMRQRRATKSPQSPGSAAHIARFLEGDDEPRAPASLNSSSSVESDSLVAVTVAAAPRRLPSGSSSSGATGATSEGSWQARGHAPPSEEADEDGDESSQVLGRGEDDSSLGGGGPAGDSTEGTGIKRQDRLAMRQYYMHGAVTLNSVSVADTESSETTALWSHAAAASKGASKAAAAHIAESSGDEDDNGGSSVSDSYDESAVDSSSVLSRTNTQPDVSTDAVLLLPSGASAPPAPPHDISPVRQLSARTGAEDVDSLDTSYGAPLVGAASPEEWERLRRDVAAVDVQIAVARVELLDTLSAAERTELDVALLRLELLHKQHVYDAMRLKKKGGGAGN